MTLKELLKREGIDWDEEIAKCLIAAVFKEMMPGELSQKKEGYVLGWNNYRITIIQNLAILGISLEETQ